MSSKLLPKHIKDELWRRGELSFLCHPVQKEMREIYYSAPKHSLPVWLLGRQSGKCLAKGTLVSTPFGPVEIQDLKVGDVIYGYNRDGSVTPTTVVAAEPQGEKEVYDLKHRNRIIASATENHKWPVYNTVMNRYEEITTEEVLKYGYKKILRTYFDLVDGEIHEPHAYALGAMLGDGYSPDHGKQFWISSIDNKIPDAVAAELGGFAHKNKGNNYTWSITSEEQKGSGVHSTLTFNHYDWMKGKLAHEKTCDLDVIKTWTRESQLRFLAGLIDTDGCIQVVGRTKNELKISLGMQAKTVIDAAKYIILSLFQIEMCEKIDDRPKYKNGHVYNIYSNNNFCAQRILKAIDPYLVTEHKKYKKKYDSFPHYNHVPYYCGVVNGGKRMVETYDIQVDNDTNLYVLANGLVTHNSWLLCTLALEEALRKPNSIVKIITDTKVHAKNIFIPKFNELLESCPTELKPDFKANEYSYSFYNGSQIQLAGTDNKHYERLRGQTTTAAFIDEAGFCSDLEDVVNSVLIPTTTHTGGKIVLSSTPPKDYDHPFINFMEKAEMEGLLTKKTIDDNPLLSKEQIHIIEKQMGGRNSEQFRREYLCVDAETLVKTKSGYKEIQNINIGDEVFTHKGRYRKVLNKFPNKKGKRKMYHVKSSNNLGIKCTEGHELYVSEYNKIDKTFTDKWVKVDDIKLSKNNRIYCKVPIDSYIDETDQYSEELAYLIGWHLAEGHVGKNFSCLSLNIKDPFGDINNASKIVWGKEYVKYNRQNKCFQAQLNNKESSVYYQQFGKGAGNKFIPQSLKTARDSIKINLIRGLFLGDGWFNLKLGRAGLTSISLKLITDTSDVLNSLGIPNQINKIREEGPSLIQGRNVYCQDCYSIKITGHHFNKFMSLIHGIKDEKYIKRIPRNFIKNGFLYNRINKIEILENYKNDIVYDIEVEEDHSYVGLHTTFHNCEILKLSTDSALPEVNDELLEKIVKVWPKPAHYDTYASMDLGFQDMTAVLFGYYDFRKDKLVIEDEIPFDFKQKGQTIRQLVSSIQAKEEELWNNPVTNEIRKPLKRVSDINHIVTNEIRAYAPDLNFSVPLKDDKKAAVNNLRVMLVNEKIIINPKCQTLIRHLKNVKWTKKGDEFARSVDDSHYDFVDALIYMMRSINYKKNPYPHGYGMDLREEDVFIANPRSFQKSDNRDVFRAIMGHKKR